MRRRGKRRNEMNPYERFVRLLYSILGMVLSGATTIEWLNSCLQMIINSPRAVVTNLPRRPVMKEGKAARKQRRPVTSELSEEHWNTMRNLFKRNEVKDDQVRLQILGYFLARKNQPIARRELRESGLIPRPWNEASIEQFVNVVLRKERINILLRPVSKAEGPWEDRKVQFWVVA